MLYIIALLYLAFRWASFDQLTSQDLPQATADDFQKIRRASRGAVLIALVAFLLGYVPFVCAASEHDREAANSATTVLNTGALLIACFFDGKAELIKKRCRAKRPTLTDSERAMFRGLSRKA